VAVDCRRFGGAYSWIGFGGPVLVHVAVLVHVLVLILVESNVEFRVDWLAVLFPELVVVLREAVEQPSGGSAAQVQ
jgi:hypothetical protein